MHPLTQLICGTTPRDGAIGEVVAHLGESLNRIVCRSRALFDSNDPDELALFGPSLGRAILEVSFTAICGRFDAIRVLAIRQSQLVPEFDLSTRNPLAFNWSADVTGGADKPKDWAHRPGAREIQRALLSGHYHDLIWKEAFERLVDDVPAHRGHEWMTRLRRLPSDRFTHAKRAEAERLFSELSKGIHHEFVIPLPQQYDRETVRDLLVRCWELTAVLGTTAAYSPIVTDIARNDVVSYLEQAQRELNLT